MWVLDMIGNMTEEQMKARMREINKIRNKLREERKEYEDYFYNKKIQNEYLYKKEFKGKCYISKELKGNKHDYIKAFKIMKIHEGHHSDFAECLALVSGYRGTSWKECGVEIMTLGLWTQNVPSMLYKESDPKMIDFYKEISEEEFYDVYNDFIDCIIDVGNNN